MAISENAETLEDVLDELGPEITPAMKIASMRHFFDAMVAAPDTPWTRDLKRKMARSYETGWEKARDLVGTVAMGQFDKDFVTRWWSIGVLFSSEFKVDHLIPLTPEQLAKGPAAGKQWYIGSAVFPFILIPGIPYIHIPGIPVYPLFRIIRTPLHIVLKTS